MNSDLGILWNIVFWLTSKMEFRFCASARTFWFTQDLRLRNQVNQLFESWIARVDASLGFALGSSKWQPVEIC